MADQQAMQDYVRARMAGTQGPPQPAVNPMQSYVLAQGALGSRVPPDTMMDSPQFTQEPDVEPGPPVQSNRDLDEQAFHARKQELFNQIDQAIQQRRALPAGSPEANAAFDRFMALGAEVDRMDAEWEKGSTAQWGRRRLNELDQSAPNANAIMQGVQNRQAQPRQPLPPPAPGSVPYAPAPQPVIPQPPATAGLTS
jgi:hypothetical protein